MQEHQIGEQRLVAIYPNVDSAQMARESLLRSGFDDAKIRISSESLAATDLPETAATRPADSGDTGGGFFSWLFGSSIPERERDWYGTHFREGRTALSVSVTDATERAKAEDILDASGPLELDWEEFPEGQMAATEVSTPSAAPKAGLTEPMQPTTALEAGKEEAIPLVKEELSVGKKPIEQRRRIRTYVVEHPVEAQVNLRDDTTIIERRPVMDKGSVTPADLQNREVEIIERREEPVVEKTAQAEELVVRKVPRERTEIVKDKVKETKVEIEGEGKPLPR